MRDNILKLKKQKMIYTVITMAVLAAALFFVYRMIYAGIIALPYPKEILEPSNIALTNEFLAGRSPYTNAALTRKVPGTNYDYPFLNSLVAASIAKITGCSAVTAHFAVSLVSILASGAAGFILTRNCLRGYCKSDRYPSPKEAGVESTAYTTIAPVLSALIFMFCHFRYGYISAAPDDLGLLILLLTSVAAVSPGIKNKPLTCAVGITLCFYTKQYLVFVAAGLFIYMLMYSVRDAVKLFVWTLVINIAAAAVITVFWPLYWTKAFFFTYLGTAVGGGGLLSTLTDQFLYILTIFGPLFIFILAALVRFLAGRLKSRKKTEDLQEAGDLYGRKPKISENDAFAMSAVQSVVMIIPLFIIGRNDGAFLSYFLQLWIPFITVAALAVFEKMRCDMVRTKDDGRRDPENAGKDIREYAYGAIYAATAAFIIYFGFGRLPLHVLTAEEISAWQEAYEYTEKYAQKGQVFYSRSLAYDAASLEIPGTGTVAEDTGDRMFGGDCICGHDWEVKADTVQTLTEVGLPDDLTGDARRIVDQNLRYREDICKKAADHTYSLITFDDAGAFTLFDEKYCEQMGYRCIDRLDLCLGNMPYEVFFYAAY